MTPMRENLVFLDLETTGLMPGEDLILEIAALPVGPKLEILDQGWSTVIHVPTVLEFKMHETVETMHRENGLLVEVAAGGLSLPAAAAEFIRYAKQFVPEGETPIAGSTIPFDRQFLIRQMPSVDRFYHYRHADVSSLKEFWKRWFPEAGEPPKVKAHRALADCYESVAEAKWYLERLELNSVAELYPI